MERIKKLIVVILCVGMISSLNISFIYASQSNGYHPLNIKIDLQMCQNCNAKEECQILGFILQFIRTWTGNISERSGEHRIMLGVWDYIDGRDFSDQTRNRKYEYRFFGETFWIFYVTIEKTIY